MTFFCCNSLRCGLVNNKEFKIRPEILNNNSNESSFYPYSILVNKCSGSWIIINDAYANLCIPNTVKNMNIEELKLISRTNETRHISWHETCKCKCRLDMEVFVMIKNVQIMINANVM